MNKWTHIPILAKEITELLVTDTSGVYLDGTIGLGGHSGYFINVLGEEGRILGFDKDKKALEMAEKNVADKRLTVVQASYLDAPQILKKLNINGVSGALFDLGLSSYQLDDAERGFSFLNEGPLDMRFDNTKGRTAADIVNALPADKLEEIFLKYGEERAARKISLAVYEARRKAPLNTTKDLARVIESVLPRSGKTHPATKVFQALRIAVNDELAAVEGLAPMLPQIIAVKGRAAVLTFHSTEDRIIKQGFKSLVEGANGGEWRLINKKVIEPSFAETRANPRARSAKLRVIERIS